MNDGCKKRSGSSKKLAPTSSTGVYGMTGMHLKRMKPAEKVVADGSREQQSRRRKMSRAHDAILKYVLKIMEVCKAQGFVYGIIPEKGKPITGSSESLRKWWKEEACFDQNGPLAVSEYHSTMAAVEQCDDVFKNSIEGEETLLKKLSPNQKIEPELDHFKNSMEERRKNTDRCLYHANDDGHGAISWMNMIETTEKEHSKEKESGIANRSRNVYLGFRI
ncbi:hypothetical protein Ccrd_013051 [Cynara cardunculus var. scolymus]|uniref:Ethylene insensitive 3-like DNA-binding domain-containing protein n=1 Tax=Cynara cardunculus var. scolymus TaxID=59895 RepID=A0A103YGF2_CYNCS|nr:hypothetical protein Ccrd_013051 [Cynara cardunculus var. scolymus]